MTRPTALRSFFHTLLTILMYSGVLIFLFPSFTGRSSSVALFALGAAVTVTAGMSRCFFTEGGCADGHHPRQRIP